MEGSSLPLHALECCLTQEDAQKVGSCSSLTFFAYTVVGLSLHENASMTSSKLQVCPDGPRPTSGAGAVEEDSLAAGATNRSTMERNKGYSPKLIPEGAEVEKKITEGQQDGRQEVIPRELHHPAKRSSTCNR